MILSTEWIFHARWWSLDTLPNILYPIFHVRMSTSERRSVNHKSNLIKVVILPQCIENHHHKPTSQLLSKYHYLNEVWIVVNSSLFTCTQSNMKYLIQHVRQGVHCPGIINERGIFIQGWKSSIWHSQYTIAITLILWLLKCVHFVFNVCSLKHDLTDQSSFSHRS